MINLLLALILMFLSPLPAFADKIEDTIKQDHAGWSVFQQASGDLNGDSKADAVAILTRPAGPEEDSVEALLVVYLAFEDAFRLHTKSPLAICVGCGGPKAAIGQPFGDVAVTDKGLLTITYMGGSREMFDLVLKWRLDKQMGQFFLIGETRTVTDTAGEYDTEVLDINYSTLKAELSVGKKKTACSVDAKYKAQELSSFDYEEKHMEDIGKINDGCKS